MPACNECLSACEVPQEVTVGRRTIEISMRSLMSGMIFSTARYSKADRCSFLCSYSGVPRSSPANCLTLSACDASDRLWHVLFP